MIRLIVSLLAALAPVCFFTSCANRVEPPAPAYQARIVRDTFGVPHIFGQRHADVAYGLAYAHAEDDWKHIEEVIRSNRGQLAEILGESAAQSDYLILALGNVETIHEGYETRTSPAAKAIAEGYAAGLNRWCADNPDTGCKRTIPVHGRDIITGYANRPPFFYGLDGELNTLLTDRVAVDMSTTSPREAFLGVTDDVELGSNALAVAPSRAADGHTRLAVNSHQPYIGTVAWYEARLKSEEGIDIIGGVFPGTPLILHGAGPNLGWAATVNRPDVYDVFLLTVDDLDNPTRYQMDGQWKELKRRQIRYNVLRDGAQVAVERTGYWSEHGPAFVTQRGVFAVSFSGAGEFGYLDQYLAMNTAKTVADWRAAQIRYNAIPSVNYVVADSSGTIAYFWNAKMPRRTDGWDRKKTLPGHISDTLWRGWESAESLPSVVNPLSGYVVNANHTPFLASASGDNPRPENYPASFGVDRNFTNRGYRAQELFGGDTSITREEFIAYKMDDTYSHQSTIMHMIADLRHVDTSSDAELTHLIGHLTAWNGRADRHNRHAALAIFTGQQVMGGQMHDSYDRARAIDALKETARLLQAATGRIDPEWGEVSRLKRGDATWPLDGGPDTLRAVYAAGDLERDGYRAGRAGDTYILIADWSGDGSFRIDTISQFGAATVDTASPHYADQAPLFAERRFRRAPMSMDALSRETTRDYRIRE
jgi:penicillin amidase/acyl-homoserine-lactone acylase